MRVAALGDVCELTMGQAPRGDTYNAEGNGLPLVAGAGDFGEVHPSPKKFTTAKGVRVSQPGDIILGIRASIGVKVLSDAPYCLGRGVAGLRAGPALDARYLWHWLSHASPTLAGKGRGATFLQVNKRDIAEMEIPLPPLGEQQRIAAILDAADDIRAKRREALAKLDGLTQAIFVDMFEVVPKRAGVESKCHPMGVLQDLAEIRSGYGFPNALQGRPDGDYPFAKVGDISALARRGRRYLTTAPNYVDEGDLAALKAKPFPPGTVAFAKIGEAIRQNHRVVTTRDALFDNNVMGLIPRGRTHTTYLFAVMRSLDLYPLAQSTTVPSIRKSDLARIAVPVPDEEAVRRFIEADAAVELERTKFERAVDAADLMTRALRSRAFAGEL